MERNDQLTEKNLALQKELAKARDSADQGKDTIGLETTFLREGI